MAAKHHRDHRAALRDRARWRRELARREARRAQLDRKSGAATVAAPEPPPPRSFATALAVAAFADARSLRRQCRRRER
jgi:hypothetical protein